MTNPVKPTAPVTGVSSKHVSAGAAIMTAIIGAVALVTPHTKAAEGWKLKAYLDPVKIPTICAGHTKKVKLGDVASPALCDQYLREDMIQHMQEVVAATPEIVDNQNALAAAGDFAFNAGSPAYKSSPMAANFKQRKWNAGCNGFIGYYVGATFDKPQPSYACKPHPKKPGKYLCSLPGLVTRRLNESKICLSGKF